jgi:hypothetical protein
MNLRNRLGRHFAACAAASAAIGASVQAEINYSGPIDLAVPNTFTGFYMNLVTGEIAESPMAGWDLNPYGTSFLTFFGGSGSAVFVNIGAYSGEVSSLPAGYEIGESSPFNSSAGGSVWTDGLTGDWTLNAVNIIGFRFTGEASETLYGWARFSLGADEGQRSIIDYAYETTGGSIIAGAIPAPGAVALLGLAGLAGSRRRRG